MPSSGAAGIRGPGLRESGERDLRLAEDHGVRPRGEVEGRVVGRVRPVHRDEASARVGRGHHREGRLAVPRRAHLRQEVEVVLENPDDRGVRGVEGAHELGLAAGEHRVEQLHVEAALAQHRRDEERREGRIRLHLPPLLGVVCEVVGMREEDLRPGSAHHAASLIQARFRNCVTWASNSVT